MIYYHVKIFLPRITLILDSSICKSQIIYMYGKESINILILNYQYLKTHSQDSEMNWLPEKIEEHSHNL